MVQIGDMTIQDQAVILPTVKVVTSFARILTAATGSVGYTGVGFKPSFLMGFALVDSTNVCNFMGFSDGTTENQFGDNRLTGGTYQPTTNFLRVEAATNGDVQSAVVSSFDVDGFTLDWTKVGSPTGSLEVSIIAFK